MVVPSKKLNGLDLFSGIGGISEALDPWVQTVAYCERERYPQGVLLSRMERGEIDTAPIWDDVTTLTADTLKEAGIEQVDIISGGFPCQDVSVAGYGRGLDGERSGLFFQIARLAGELGHPKLYLENVSAILVRGGWSVVGTLAAMGYDCRWGVLEAGSPIVGARHHRARWWLVANHIQKRNKGKRPQPLERVKRVPWGENGRSVEVWPRMSDIPQRGLCRAYDGAKFEKHRVECLGNSVVPQCAREAFKRLIGLT